MLIMVIIFLLITQTTSGPIKYIHLYETCVDSAAGVAQLFFCIVNPGSAIISEFLIEKSGTNMMLIFFASWTLLGFVYYVKFLKDTRGLTDKEK